MLGYFARALVLEIPAAVGLGHAARVARADYVLAQGVDGKLTAAVFRRASKLGHTLKITRARRLCGAHALEALAARARAEAALVARANDRLPLRI